MPREKQLLDWLNADPSRVQIILSKLEIDYQPAESGEKAVFALE